MPLTLRDTHTRERNYLGRREREKSVYCMYFSFSDQITEILDDEPVEPVIVIITKNAFLYQFFILQKEYKNYKYKHKYGKNTTCKRRAY